MMKLSPKDLASFLESKSAWVTEAGEHKILIGALSLNIKQTVSFSVKEETIVEKVRKSFALDLKFTELKP